MYSHDTINQFIELRAKRISIQKILPQLRVSRATAMRWEARYKPRIAQLRAVFFEAICEKAGLNYEQEVTYAAAQLACLRAELSKRKLDYVSTEFIYNAEVTAFARVQKLWAMAEMPDTPPPAAEPPDEPVDPAPETPSPQNETFLRPFRYQNGGEGAQNQPQPPTSAAPAVHPCPSKDVNASEADTLHLGGRERVGDTPVSSTPTRTPPNSPPVVANPNPL